MAKTFTNASEIIAKVKEAQGITKASEAVSAIKAMVGNPVASTEVNSADPFFAVVGSYSGNANEALDIYSDGDIYINGLKETASEGSVQKKGNRQIGLWGKADISLKNVKCTAGGYNWLELPPCDTNGREHNATSITIDGVEHTGLLTHNGVCIYNMADGCKIVVKNVDFTDMSGGNGNGQFFRFSNWNDAKNVEVLFENCHMTNTYMGNASGYDYDWATFGFTQDDKGNLKDYSTWTMSFKNCTYNGDPVMNENKNVFCVWDSQGGNLYRMDSGYDKLPVITTENTMSEAELKKYKDRFKALCGSNYASKPVNKFIK